MHNPAVTANPYGEIDVEYLNRFLSTLPSTPPASYIEYLRTRNGGKFKNNMVFLSGKHFCSVHEYFGLLLKPSYLSLEENYNRYKDRINKYFLPIATDPGGNIFGISLNEKSYGEIYFWEHEYEGQDKPLVWLSNDFSSFISSLKKRKLSHLDQILEDDDKNQLHEYLLANNVGLEVVDEYDSTVLERAVIRGSAGCIKYLHGRGVKKEFNDVSGQECAVF
ncbi:MAG: SMI1/KNR4 family protein [Reinekea sp.]